MLLGHQVRFSVKEGAAGERFISVEDLDRRHAAAMFSYMYLDLRASIDLAGANQLARLMNEEIASLRIG
jgi:hypothetical protein